MNKFFLVFWILILFTGCKSTIAMPQYNNHYIAQYGESKNTIKSIEKSIIKGALSLGWKTDVISEGEILATLNIRKHQLTVMITHDEKTMSVDYQSSVNLKYDAKKNKIHRQYANWVTNLFRAVDVQNLNN